MSAGGAEMGEVDGRSRKVAEVGRRWAGVGGCFTREVAAQVAGRSRKVACRWAEMGVLQGSAERREFTLFEVAEVWVMVKA
jgi:hypothetical protein